jgi:GNAT superfamily N-acetyltransferase
MNKNPSAIDPTDAPAPGTYEAIFQALDACSRHLIGPARPRVLVIPIRDDAGVVRGGLWGCTMFEWLHVQMLVVPESLRGQGIGSALMALAEMEARARGCRGMHVDTFSFQAESFYRKLGFSLFGVLEDFPPGHKQLYFCKHFDVVPEQSEAANQEAMQPA